MKLKIPDTIRITNPLWVKKFETRKTWGEVNSKCVIKGVKLDINDYSCCVVGEVLDLHALNYNKFCMEYGSSLSTYELNRKFHKGCIRCYEFSMDIHSDVNELEYDGDGVELEKTLQLFAEHLEVDHPDIIQEKKDAVA